MKPGPKTDDDLNIPYICMCPPGTPVTRLAGWDAYECGRCRRGVIDQRSPNVAIGRAGGAADVGGAGSGDHRRNGSDMSKPQRTTVRTTVQLSDNAHDQIRTSAADLGLSVPDYIRRALAMTKTLDRYMVDGTLSVVKPDGTQVDVTVVGP